MARPPPGGIHRLDLASLHQTEAACLGFFGGSAPEPGSPSRPRCRVPDQPAHLSPSATPDHGLLSGYEEIKGTSENSNSIPWICQYSKRCIYRDPSKFILYRDQDTVDDLAQLGPVLYECAANVVEGSFDKTDRSLRKIRKLASVVDGPLQRLSMIIADSLARRILYPIQGFAAALIDPSLYLEQCCLRAARENFASISPYLSTGFVTINRAILEQVQDEKVVRIIDLSCSSTHPWQWIKILHDFHGRPGGPPELRLTVVHEDIEFLDNMQAVLSQQAATLMPSFHNFHFDKVIGRLETLDFSNLREVLKINFGEAVVISCALKMHRLLTVDDNVSLDGIAQLQQMANKAQLKQMASSMYSPASTLSYPQTPSPQRQIPNLLVSFLAAVRTLKPKILVMMEQEADHNAPLFHDRFAETLPYYAALFDSLHAVAATDQQRARMERMLLGEEIKNILVCEGVQRHERHERLSQWEMHMQRCEFEHVPLSFEAIREGKARLIGYRLKECCSIEDNGRILLCWGATRLYSISAWRPQR